MPDKCQELRSRRPNPSIVMTSPDNDHPTHSRRPLAANSVSLLHSARPSSHPVKVSKPLEDDARQKSSPLAEPGVTNSPSSLEALVGKGSSGESSNAERWFEKSNNEVKETSASFADNEPPFFMRNSSASQTPPDVDQNAQRLSSAGGGQSLPLRTGLLRLGTDGSSTEDFRSVIDDLTIENKHLKRRLKKYEKFHDSHLKDEKLFEVRIHGLPAEKKRELEETLRKFASSLGPAGASAFPPNGYASLMPMLNKGKAASSQTSLHHTDSAYASMSTSGQGSSGPTKDDRGFTPSQHPAVRRQNIHNYLHHIPEGLQPQQNPANMTERAKRKLVVRRMEQIFAGKGAAAGGHLHSEQQQEVSQSAARTDRNAMEAAGGHARQEGAREANIMDRDAEGPVGPATSKQEALKERNTQRLSKEDRYTLQELAEQRPTRPLDLDPHRAQVPAENIRYLRQMGFSPPEPESNRAPEEDHGWIYLNFLMNMAQLHTINVTTEFVRKALSEYSDKLEVSSDGRKVRWKGGNRLTTLSSPGGGVSSNEHTHNSTPDGRSPRKRPKLAHVDSRSNVQQVGGASSRSRPETNKFAYTPLFSHRTSSDDADDSSSEEEEADSFSSPFRPPIAGDSSGMTSSGGLRTSSGFRGPTLKRKQKHDDGPIIFYNNARFCTDLSGDRQGHANYNAPSYTVASHQPIGKPRSGHDGPIEMRGPLAQASELPEPMDLGDNPIPEAMELSFPAQSPPRPPSLKEQKPIDLEVTGIGGVWPTDNFSISVQSRQARVAEEQEQAGVAAITSTGKGIPPRFASLLRREDSAASSASSRVRKQVVASKVQKLPPSRLPPALNFMPFGDESEDDDTSDVEDNESEAPESPGALPPSAAPQPVEIRYATSEDEDDDDDDDDEEEDGEIDFLASARAAEPETVWRQEREYDANMADRLADEIPAGSSAATAGGGSGFASPADGAISTEEYRRALKDARGGAARQVVDARRASDSNAKVGKVLAKAGSSLESSSDDVDEDGTSDIKS